MTDNIKRQIRFLNESAMTYMVDYSRTWGYDIAWLFDEYNESLRLKTPVYLMDIRHDESPYPFCTVPAHRTDDNEFEFDREVAKAEWTNLRKTR